MDLQNLTRDDLDHIRFGLSLVQQLVADPAERDSAARTAEKVEQLWKAAQ